MNKNLKKFFIFLALLFVFTLLQFPYQFLGKTVYKQIKSQLQKNNIELYAKEAKLSFPAQMKFSKATLKLLGTQFRFPETNNGKLPIEEALFTLKILPLVLLKQNLESSFMAFGGRSSVNLSKAFFGEAVSTDFDFEGLKIETLPKLTQGKVEGILSVRGDLSGIQESKSVLKALSALEGNIKLNVHKAQYSGGDKIAGLVLLPSIKNIKVDAEATLKDSEIDISYFSLQSSIGIVNGNYRMSLSELGQAKEIKSEIDIELTEQGEQLFSGYLALAGNLPVDTKSKNWKLVITKEANELFPITRASPQ